jgi:two-component system NarL family response regulator
VTSPGRSRVLLADDHAVVRLGLRALIDHQPDLQVVAEAETGSEAVARFLELQPDIGLVDLLLPGKDGAEVCAAIRQELPRARILIVSSSSGSEHIHRALKAGAQGYLLKDASPTALLSAIRSVIAGGRVIPAAVAQGMAERAYQSDLSPRESEVITLVVEGLSNKAIAERLGLTEATVKTHITHIFEKLGVEDRTQAALAAVKRGIVRSP